MKFLVVGATLLVGCKTGNFVTVTVEGLPCDTVSIDVDVSIDGQGSATTKTFSDVSQLDDGASSFALDMGDRKNGTLDVQITAREANGQSLSGMSSIPLPATSLDVMLPGPGCQNRAVDADLSCWGGFAPSNFNPCAPDFPPAVDFLGGSFNTDTDPNAPLYSFDATHPVRLLHVHDMNILGAQTFTVMGSLPLLIVVDGTAQIDGTITFETSTSSLDCADVTQPGPTTGNHAAGGGGGGFGTMGGNGGNSQSGGDAGGGGAQTTTPQLVPLRTGCIGGKGADDIAAGGGGGGEVAGAIEISAMTAVTVTVDGLIELNGGFGTGGGRSTDGLSYGGGGGGASGGAILLEAPQLVIDGHVCAVGGGGGAGGNSTTGGGNGTRLSSCVNLAAGGGGSPGSNNHGGGGDGGGGIPATDGGDGSAIVSGGGGGGAVGQIRFHSDPNMPPMVGASGVVVPGYVP